MGPILSEGAPEEWSGAVEDADHFDVESVGGHVGGCRAGERVPGGGEEAGVAAEGGGIAAHEHDPTWRAGADYIDAATPETGAARVGDDERGRVPAPFRAVGGHRLHAAR